MARSGARLCLVALVALAGCSTPAPDRQPPQAGQAFRAQFNAAGMATIGDAPPAPFTPVVAGDPPPRTAEQVAADAQFQRVAAFQGRVATAAQALDDRLRSKERGNYVSLYYDNEGEPSAVFQFLRDGPETLRRYTRDPRFIGMTVRWSEADLKAAADWMWATFGKDRVVQSTGIGRDEVNAEINVSEADFRALLKRKGVTIPEAVALQFGAAPVVPLISPPRAAPDDPAVAAVIAPHIRIFPRHDRPAGAVNSINSRVKVVLKDGCFRAADHGDALVLFPFGAKLFIDGDNYLAFGSAATPGYARVGEPVTFTGSVAEIAEPVLTDPIHAACGPGKVIKVEDLASAAAFDRQQRVTDDANAVRRLRAEFGLDEAQARRAFAWLERCQSAQRRQRDANGVLAPPITAEIFISSLPRPVMNASECPPGSKLTFGLCRTPQGYLRPLPQWLTEFLELDQ